MKNVCFSKNNVRKTGKKAVDWEKIFTTHISKGLYPEYTKKVRIPILQKLF